MSNHNFNINISETKEDRVIAAISGELVIDNAEEIKAELQKHIIYSKDIVINIEYDSIIDLSFLQLLISALKQRKAENKKSKVNFNLDDTNIALLNKTGFSELFTSLTNN